MYLNISHHGPERPQTLTPRVAGIVVGQGSITDGRVQLVEIEGDASEVADDEEEGHAEQGVRLTVLDGKLVAELTLVGG